MWQKGLSDFADEDDTQDESCQKAFLKADEEIVAEPKNLKPPDLPSQPP